MNYYLFRVELLTKKKMQKKTSLRARKERKITIRAITPPLH